MKSARVTIQRRAHRMESRMALLGGVFLLLPQLAVAGVVSGTVDEVVVDTDGGVLVNVNGAYQTRPACSTEAGYNRMSLDRTKAGYRELVAGLLAALHSGHGVTAVGTGQCPTGPSSTFTSRREGTQSSWRGRCSLEQRVAQTIKSSVHASEPRRSTRKPQAASLRHPSTQSRRTT